jgi:hypothetical protein
MIVITIIIRREWRAVMLTPNNTFRARMLSVTNTMDKPKERAILSIIFICWKKTIVQAKPGRKKTRINPRSALITGKRSKKGRANSKICLIGDNHSTSYALFNTQLNAHHTQSEGQLQALHVFYKELK